MLFDSGSILFYLIMKQTAPIGIFDSGYGGLTILDKIRQLLPDYDYLYLGDNARTPYGTRSFDVVYRFTKEAVFSLFEQGCPLIILACNTASAKALRTIQQNDLHLVEPYKRVLGVIRPTVEIIDELTQTKHVGVLATAGTISSHSYTLEIHKLFPEVQVTGKACPMWVPLIENNEFESLGADYFIQKYVDEILTDDPLIDTLILGCTHYPLIIDKIRSYLPAGVRVFPQGQRVAESLKDYLYRHPDMEQRLSKRETTRFLTTEASDKFSDSASLFLNAPIQAEQIVLGGL